MTLDIEDLMALEQVLQPVLNENLTQILSRLNRLDKLHDFLDLIGHSELWEESRASYKPGKNGIIVVIGDSQIKENIMQGILKELGINKRRLECYLGYAEAKRFSYRKLQYNPKYSLVLVGSMGHKAQDIGNYSSAISMMEYGEGYPRVKRLGTHELKITKSNFKKALEEALAEGLIRSDVKIQK